MKQNTYKQLAVSLVMAMVAFTSLNAGGFSSSRSSGGGGSSRSSSFSSSRSSPSVSRPSPSVSKPSSPAISKSSTPAVSKPSAPVASPPKTGFSSSTKTTTVTNSKPVVSTPKTAFDKSQAIRSITPPKPKEQYIADFKAQNAVKYPTTFSSPPAQRPSYIPPTTVYNGQSTTIYYNQQAGGYGFLNGLGQFMIYDAITNMATRAFDKDQTEYVRKVEEVKNEPTYIKKESKFNWLGLFLCILALGSFGYLFYYVRQCERA